MYRGVFGIEDLLCIEVSFFQGVGIEGFHYRDVFILGGE